MKDDNTIILHFEKLSGDQPIEGFWKYYHRLRNLGVVVVPERYTQTWSIDFMTDVLSDGTKFRSLNVIDDLTGKFYSLKSIILKKVVV